MGRASDEPAKNQRQISPSPGEARTHQDSGGEKTLWYQHPMTAPLVAIAGVVLVAVGLIVGLPAVEDALTPTPPAPTNPEVQVDNSEDTEIGWTTRYVTASNDFLTVKAEMHPEAICKGATGWVFQQKPEQLPALPFDGDANDWAMSNGGIPGSGNYISLTVSVANEHDVTMEELGVIPVREDPPVTGTAPLLSGGCGPVTQAFFEADLDKDVVRPVAGQDSAGRKIEPAPMPRRLSPADPTEIWHLRANTEKCDCRFIPYFTFTVDGAEHKFEIPNGNWPWRVSSAKDAQLVHRLDERGEWVATPAGN